MSFVIDLTDRKRAQAELERANDALRGSNEELQQFAYGVSHDLQEPLRTITAFSQLLGRKVEGSLDDDSRQLSRPHRIGFRPHAGHAARSLAGLFQRRSSD